MRWTKLLVTTLVVAATLQTLPAQTSKPQASNADAGKAKQFELARVSQFEFSRLSGVTPSSVAPRIVWLRNPQPLATLPGKDSDLCYTMRVYRFSREDGQAPRMTGSTTCTPANRVGLKDATAPEPKVKYVPQ